MKQHWFVIPIDVKYDQRVSPVLMEIPENQNQLQEEIPVLNQENHVQLLINELVPEARNNRAFPPARAARRRDAGDPLGNPMGTEYGYKMDRDTMKQIDVTFTSRKLAEKHAASLAAKSPGKQFGVFGCLLVFETTTPNVVVKQFSEGGELVLKGGE